MFGVVSWVLQASVLLIRCHRGGCKKCKCSKELGCVEIQKKL